MTQHRTVTLDRFEVRQHAVGAGDPAQVALDVSPEDWIPAVVPGGVHESLLAAGRIAEPYYGANERTVDWVQEREWWYRTRFARPEGAAHDERVRLVFDGLDTVADVWLNGARLGHHENQFRPAAFDVTDQLRDENLLLVRFSPPLLGRQVPAPVAATLEKVAAAFGGAEAAPPEDGMMRYLPLATTLRKAAFSWGWDFGPHVPSIGIWREVHLSVEPRAVLSGHHVALTALAPDLSAGTVRVRVEATGTALAALTAHATLVAPSGRRFEVDVPIAVDGTGAGAGTGTGTAEIALEDPELWWTHDLGEPALHDVTLELREGADLLDVATDRVGLRTLVLDRSADEEEGGRLFRFVLNGVPLFARGASWLPASTLVGSVPAGTYRDRVLRAREGNLTMLRVWGGGIYEHDAFYAACDELGVLVWQDFMFACTDYPDADPALRREVELEAAYQVRRLRNRACLALWAGNNEVHVIHLAAWLNVDEGDWGWHFFHEALPAAVAAHDGITPYWPGSPYGEGRGIFSINGTDDGDRHTWEVWHGMVVPGMTIGGTEFPTVGDARHYRRYADDTAKFVSEFGIHAAPELATLRRWIPADELAVHSATFDLHNKDNPKDKGDELLAVTTGLPGTLDEYVAYTQAVQAEGMAFGLEHYRQRQPHTSGALMWQYGDVWPGLSWSIVDYDGVPKAAYYAARRACAPLAASFARTAAGDLELWLANNTRRVARLAVEVETGDFSGSDRHGERVTAEVAPSSSACVWTLPADRVPADARHYAWASSPDGAFPAARTHFVEIGQLDLPPAVLEVTAEPGALRIRATGYAYLVRVEQPVPGIRLSDNCFDLRDGDEVTIRVEGADPAGLAVAAFPARGRQAVAGQ